MENSVSLPPDNIPEIFLKKCMTNLCKPLHIIFNLSLQTGVFLDSWKSSFITPIHKSGSKQSIENYRPIAKLQLIPKVFESLVKTKMYDAVKAYISPFQHGFVTGKSTATNLTLLTNFCINTIEKRSQVDVIYTDFSKAFDRVSHKLLLSKLRSLGFHSQIFDWIKSYLENRVQSVKIGQTKSEIISNYSGVPQGSHLGPLLFILFVNDLPSFVLDSQCLSFADDFKIYRAINSFSDCLQLQNDLTSLSKWCLLNDLDLNINKCCVLTFTRTFSPIFFDYFISDNVLQRVFNHKDLGVIFDSKLDFRMHVDYIVSRGNSMLGFLFRNSKEFKCHYTIKSLFVS